MIHFTLEIYISKRFRHFFVSVIYEGIRRLIRRNMQKNATEYSCEKCNFKCSKESNFNTHLLTSKHKKRTNTKQILLENAKKYKCECGKTYKHASSLWNHKKQCDKSNTEKASDADDISSTNPITVDKMLSMFNTILVQNQEFMMNVISQVKSNNTHINNTTNNNQFNINVFLNDQCKDAMNLADFVHNIKCQVEDLENVGRVGYVAGISKMLIDNLSNLEVTKRPIHCTDVKRKSMYVKKDNEWKKDDKNEEVRKAINQVANKNIQNIEGWRIKNIDQTGNSVTGGTAKRQQYLDIVGQSLEPDDDGKKSEKILKNLSEAVLLDKVTMDSAVSNE